MSEQSINLTNMEPGGHGAGMEEGASPTARSGMISLADLDLIKYKVIIIF